jgi:hypothetical protein
MFPNVRARLFQSLDRFAAFAIGECAGVYRWYEVHRYRSTSDSQTAFHESHDKHPAKHEITDLSTLERSFIHTLPSLEAQPESSSQHRRMATTFNDTDNADAFPIIRAQ